MRKRVFLRNRKKAMGLGWYGIKRSERLAGSDYMMFCKPHQGLDFVLSVTGNWRALIRKMT